MMDEFSSLEKISESGEVFAFDDNFQQIRYEIEVNRSLLNDLRGQWEYNRLQTQLIEYQIGIAEEIGASSRVAELKSAAERLAQNAVMLSRSGNWLKDKIEELEDKLAIGKS